MKRVNRIQIGSESCCSLFHTLLTTNKILDGPAVLTILGYARPSCRGQHLSIRARAKSWLLGYGYHGAAPQPLHTDAHASTPCIDPLADYRDPGISVLDSICLLRAWTVVVNRSPPVTGRHNDDTPIGDYYSDWVCFQVGVVQYHDIGDHV